MNPTISEQATNARAAYDAALADLPPRRRWGIRYAKVFFFIGSLVLLLFYASVIWQIRVFPYSADSQDESRFRWYATFAILILVANFLWRRSNPQHRTVRHTFRNYPKVRETVKRCKVGPEVFRRYLPILRVGGQTFFIADYRMRHDPQFQRASTSLLIDSEGRVLSDEALYSRVYVTLNLGHATSFGTQSYVENERKGLRKTERRILPKWRRAMLANQKRFEQLGAADKLQTILQRWNSVIDEGRDRDRYWDYEQKCVRSLGYGFALEILEEEALHAKRAEIALANLIEREYYQPAVDITFAAADLWSLVENNSGWKRRRALRNALYFLKNYQPALREAIKSFRSRSDPPDDVWRAYREGLALARRIGVPVVDGRLLQLSTGLPSLA